MAPKKQTKRTAAQARKKAIRQLNRAIEGLTINQDTSETACPLPPSLKRRKAQKTSNLPKRIKGRHIGQELPIWLHVVDPQNRHVTREVQVTLKHVQSLKTVNAFVQSSFGFEMKRAGIDADLKVRVGLATYGPSTDFSNNSIVRHTQGSFTSNDDFKSWWLGLSNLLKNEGETVKIAATFWDKMEAGEKGFEVPAFWNHTGDKSTEALGSEMEEPEWNIDLNNLGHGHRGDAAMQEPERNGPQKRRGGSRRDAKGRTKGNERELAISVIEQDGDVFMEDALVSG
ncbi:hypothetical protein LTR84_005084 [Exophiala bonariae]|uniref:Uncharacterized protein n=1 Tax=Exophiala bonariae TaxID=1690606 RepID=A0AAV9NPD1_9EURO|nr:hypothetical protein LTR84_005084 [Exophiala bonariae]